jgi:alpha-glucosidase
MKAVLRQWLVLAILSVFPAITRAAVADQTVVSSPDGHLQLHIRLQQEQLMFHITLNKQTVIGWSPVSMQVDSMNITRDVSIGKGEAYRVDETYDWYGAHTPAVNRCNGLKLPLRHKSGLAYTLEVRVFNDAAAFRLVIPGKEDDQRIPDEATSFLLPAGSVTWYHDLASMHYEGIHSKKDVSAIGAGEWAAPPLTFKLSDNGGYASITEANLQHYSGMGLQADGKGGFTVRLAHHQPASYPYVLRYGKEEAERLSRPATVTGTITTPWRLVLAGADLNALVNSDAVHDLCPPPDKAIFPRGAHTSWVRPGRAVWKYLDGGGASTVETMKEFSRMAGELGFEYNILEGFWSKWSDEEIRDLVQYSAQRKVGIIVWQHSKTLHDAAFRHALFERCHRLGIAGLKIDFFDHEARETIDLYDAILEETAKLQLVVNFHGANKPTGLSRTWPNELTREAVKGMEASKLADRATHNTTIPFTRWLAGAAEYTPVHFGERRKNTTWAHQVASAVVFDAPLLTYGASPANILSNPALDMIKSIPSVWDETIVLPGSAIGEVAAFARRKGDTWFIAVMNGVTPRTLEVPLSFLKDGNYQAMVVRDNKDSTAAMDILQETHKRGDVIKIALGEGGGFIARLKQ